MSEQEQIQEEVNENPSDAPTVNWAEERATLVKERDEFLDQWKRSAAEFINYKKREERLRLDRERSANQRVLKKLLPLLDDFRRAVQHRPEELVENEWVNGMLAIERKLWNVLEQEGVTPIAADTGTEFDPNVHEALISQEQEGVEAGQIISELERGYKHGDSILRPSRVIVSR
jgi:molecular chaperone GrpE